MTDNDNNKTPAPGSSLFAGINDRMAVKPDTAEPASSPAEPVPVEPAADLEVPIPFSTEGLPAGLEIVKAPEPLIASHAPADLPTESVIAAFTLGETQDIQQLHGLEALRQATHSLLAQAQREILIVSMDLELPRYDNDDFVELLSQFARSSRYTTTRILIGTPQLAVREGHKLVNLARRLSSLIHVRQVHETDLDEIESWIIADIKGVLRCTSRDPWLGTLNPKAIPHAKHYRDKFDELWNRGDDVPDFREIRI